MIETNKIYNENFLDGVKRIDDSSIDLICTDPPYRVTTRGCYGTTGGMLKSDLCLKGKIFEHNDIDISEYAGELFRILKDKTHLYIMCNHINLIEYLNELSKVGFHFTKSLIWRKPNKIMGRYYMSEFEYILFFRKGGERVINNCGTADILDVPFKKNKIDGKNIHDTQKPIELMEILIGNSTDEGETVLDPFMGSGTTAIACRNTKRNYVGFEIDKTYCDMANKRVEAYMKQQTIF